MQESVHKDLYNFDEFKADYDENLLYYDELCEELYLLYDFYYPILNYFTHYFVNFNGFFVYFSDLIVDLKD